MRYNPIGKTILALETSCDESAVALLRKKPLGFELLASRIASQVEEHAQWGGVVPEIASRRHLEALPFLIEQVLDEAEQEIQNLDAVAATVTPGLAGALMVGSVTGRTLASLHEVPFLGIHHLEGHLASVQLAEKTPSFPYLVLLVSGGHTELILVRGVGLFQRLGRTHDDAAGEAFDKVARLLGLSYPGGPAIQKLAEKGDPNRFSLPKGRVSKPGGGFYPYDFSFSGLKTAMLRKIKALENTSELPVPLEDLAASFEKVVAEVLIDRSFRCALDVGVRSLVLVGGVAANKRLRQMIQARALTNNLEIHMAPLEFCTDNAAMVGAAALMRLEYDLNFSSIELGVSPRWPLEKADWLYQSTPPF